MQYRAHQWARPRRSPPWSTGRTLQGIPRRHAWAPRKPCSGSPGSRALGFTLTSEIPTQRFVPAGMTVWRLEEEEEDGCPLSPFL